jgi:hypothetical protein
LDGQLLERLTPIMNALVVANRKALAGIAFIFLFAGIVAGLAAVSNPDLLASFSASATPIVTGQTPAISVVSDHQETKLGVFSE